MAFRGIARAAFRVCALSVSVVAAVQAAELKDVTVNAWDAYIAQENKAVEHRAGKPQDFLWSDAASTRIDQVRAGEVVVAPFSNHEPLKVTGGLIHHWIGAVFIPNCNVQDILAVTRDYANYKVYYKPGVADASVRLKTDQKDVFSLRFVNVSVLSKTSLLGNYISKFVRINDKQWYSTSETTEMYEIHDFGRANEKRFPSNEGSGYIWRLYSTARLEDRDGGVVLEIEAVVLSRDIPAALRWV